MSAPLLSATPAISSGNLGASARTSLLWGGGFTLLRDVAQFGVMLILVRLLMASSRSIMLAAIVRIAVIR